MGMAYFLFLPFAVKASRSFQPDPLMSALIALTAFAAYRWVEAERPRWRQALTVGVLGGLAVLVKAFAVIRSGRPAGRPGAVALAVAVLAAGAGVAGRVFRLGPGGSVSRLAG